MIKDKMVRNEPQHKNKIMNKMEIERTQTQWKNQRKNTTTTKKTSEKEREKEPEPNKIQGRKGMGRKGEKGDGILENDH